MSMQIKIVVIQHQNSRYGGSFRGSLHPPPQHRPTPQQSSVTPQNPFIEQQPLEHFLPFACTPHSAPLNSAGLAALNVIWEHEPETQNGAQQCSSEEPQQFHDEQHWPEGQFL
ncbi:hypothetical protein MP228_007019 [Amoeboaphelidium protococcarum]|nr:hypothetical protein MP228_007019 [Amoeboaphelidium protococcarum]